MNDFRWAGSYGVQVDFIARSHCSVEIIKTEDIMVWSSSYITLAIFLCLVELLSTINVQAVLEKFEFFPIKCRILRTAQQFSQYQNKVVSPGDAGNDSEKLKTKVWSDVFSAP